MAFLTASARHLYGKISSDYNQTGEPHILKKGINDVGKQLKPDMLKKIANGVKAPLSSDQSAFMKAVGRGPFMDAFGEFHDGLHELPYMPVDQVSLIITMPPSYVLTVTAWMQPYTYLYLMERNRERGRQ